MCTSSQRLIDVMQIMFLWFGAKFGANDGIWIYCFTLFGLVETVFGFWPGWIGSSETSASVKIQVFLLFSSAITSRFYSAVENLLPFQVKRRLESKN